MPLVYGRLCDEHLVSRPSARKSALVWARFERLPHNCTDFGHWVVNDVHSIEKTDTYKRVFFVD